MSNEQLDCDRGGGGDFSDGVDVVGEGNQGDDSDSGGDRGDRLCAELFWDWARECGEVGV